VSGMKITGRVVTGSQQGAKFTRLEWAQRQFVQKLGIDPFPGTLNLILETPDDLQKWNNLRASPHIEIIPPNEEWCTAYCFPARIDNLCPGAIVYPDVRGYPANQIEIVAALPLRTSMSLVDGDTLTLQVNRPQRVGTVIFNVDE
jgi:CTP-dependent riboflavin kinase